MTEQSASSARAPRILMNPPVFITSAVLTLVFVLFAAIFTETAGTVFSAVQGWISESVGWFYVLAVAGFVVFMVGVAVSSYGTIKLGPDHSRPDYSYASWFAMLFSAGMGIGLMFFGVAEPVMHYVTPPVGDPETVEAARQSMRITLFHWGVHAWAIYGVVALSLAYFAFRHDLPLTIRSSLYPLIGDRIHGGIGHTVDTFAVLGTIFGVATSLGFGVMQINSGLNYLFDIPNTLSVQVILIVVITAIATLSVALGLDGGIRRISVLNMILAGGLLAFVLVAGPTVYLLQTLVQNTGNYMSNLFSMTFNLYAYEPTSWIGGWTLFYWGWWIAWAPFVGMFIARVSRGRTIREFTFGVLLVPVGFTIMWMTFFGNTALHMIMEQGITELADAVAADTSVALFQFFEHLPLSSIMAMVATLLVVTFFVTSSDSGSLVVDILTSGGREESPTWQRIFWAVIEGVVAAALLIAGGLAALQTATIASALPFAIIMCFMCWGLLRALRIDTMKRISLQARVLPIGPHSPLSWQSRLRAIVHQPRRNEVMRYIQEAVKPALEAVAEELRKQNRDAHTGVGEDGRCWVEVRHGEEIDFFYSVRPRAYEPPTFVMRDTRSQRAEALKYFHAEVHLSEGGQDYDVMGWSKDAIINDVLEHYERHMHFLSAVR
ncbi:BCCT family transporter [Ectothiorhodospira lacustris]|uniref:BCCT family transporter n=1 Tax=Ectothiorhodospira lacustris TaxID=2899127 RepID=UPI001EE9ABC3|nr:choline BCCT transporter BetT [Ectothiorhodospira lacustris]MCG5499226.1 choline BCCT transporter BetT [Ectothiorhodospira lacustris]MCG5509720.1 choline BCCT transporter BetT [Ectothiorhodospira lacustris]MCG5522366.1 choline BCCT transporter BetT [Ectothiorhodospira lacustris]